jgi:hypothetical protein
LFLRSHQWCHLAPILTYCPCCFADKASAARACLRTHPDSVWRHSTLAPIHDGGELDYYARCSTYHCRRSRSCCKGRGRSHRRSRRRSWYCLGHDGSDYRRRARRGRIGTCD